MSDDATAPTAPATPVDSKMQSRKFWLALLGMAWVAYMSMTGRPINDNVLYLMGTFFLGYCGVNVAQKWALKP